MNKDLIKVENNKNYGLVVSSRVIAEGLGKRHSDVIESLEKISQNSEITENGNLRSLIIPTTYRVESQKREYKEYLLTKDGFILYMFNIQGYNDFKMAYITRFNEMENALKNHTPKTYLEALEELVEKVKQNEILQLENKAKDQQIAELKPKATYYDLILQCKDAVSISKVSKDYGMSAIAMNKLLNKLGVQYKQGDMWLLYAKYQDKGYTQSKTHNYDKGDGSQGVAMSTYWTQKGRLFIYDLLKNSGVTPLIEHDAVSA